MRSRQVGCSARRALDPLEEVVTDFEVDRAEAILEVGEMKVEGLLVDSSPLEQVGQGEISIAALEAEVDKGDASVLALGCRGDHHFTVASVKRRPPV